MKMKVSFIKGNDRKENIIKALNLIEPEIKEDIDKQKEIILKPNVIDTTRYLACTHPDALRAVLNYLSSFWKGKIIIAEGSGIGDTTLAFKKLGYFDLIKEYPNYKIEFVDLNIDSGVEIEILDWQLRPLKIKVAKTLIRAPYIISICLPKTHDSVIVTLSIKNVLMASPLRRLGGNSVSSIVKIIENLGKETLFYKALRKIYRLATREAPNLTSYKSLVHQGPIATNRNLAIMAKHIFPNLAIIDGWVGMEGNGPVDGSPVPWQIAIASKNPLAADTLSSYLMGFNPKQIGYLNYLGADLDNLLVLGNNINECRKNFKPHPTFSKQLKWTKHLIS